MAENKASPQLWATITIAVAIIACLGTIISALIAKIPVSTTSASTQIPVMVVTVVVPQSTSAEMAQILSSIEVPANSPTGISTGLTVKQGDILTFSASGKWCWGGTTDCSSPDGTLGRPSGPEECCAVFENDLFGKLIGRVGNWTFPIGSQSTVTMEQDGELFLLMNDRIGTYDDNSSSIIVNIETQNR